MGVRLPTEYQEVEYVWSTGTQAFFTDVPIQDGLTVDSVQTFAGGDSYLFGGNNGKGVQISFNGTYNGRGQSAYAGFYYWNNETMLFQTNNTTKYHVVSTQRNGEQIGFLDGVQVHTGTRTTTKDTSAGATAALFGQRNASGALSMFYKGKLYSCKVSKDGTLLADFVPCYRKADGEIGMYDLVLQKFYSNDGTGVFLKGDDVIDSISPWMVARRNGIIAAHRYEPILVTATGNPLSFVTDMVRPLKSLVIPFSPVQEGEGDPSPDNVRPISGWSGAKLKQTNKNLVDGAIVKERILSSVTTTRRGITIEPWIWFQPSASDRWPNIFGFASKDNGYKFKADTQYTIAFEVTSQNNDDTLNIGISYTDGTNRGFKLSDRTHDRWIVYHTTAGKTPYSLYVGAYIVSKWTSINYDTMCIMEGIHTYDEIVAQQINNLPITFTDPSTGDPMTVYGGTLTLNEDGSADVVVTHGAKPIPDWTYYTIRKQNPAAGWDTFQLYLPATDISATRGAIVDGKPNIWSSEFVAVANAATNPDYSIRKANVYIYLAVPENTYANWDEFKTALADVPIVYPLATPLTYHFPNIGQLQSFLGENNIWHDMNGSITAEYWNKQ